MYLTNGRFREVESRQRIDDMTKRYSEVKTTVASLENSMAKFNPREFDMDNFNTALSVLKQLQNKMHRLISDASEGGAEESHVTSFSELLASAQQTIDFTNQLKGSFEERYAVHKRSEFWVLKLFPSWICTSATFFDNYCTKV